MGEKILSTLIKLLAEQEKVKIKYEVKKDEKQDFSKNIFTDALGLSTWGIRNGNTKQNCSSDYVWSIDCMVCTVLHSEQRKDF